MISPALTVRRRILNPYYVQRAWVRRLPHRSTTTLLARRSRSAEQQFDTPKCTESGSATRNRDQERRLGTAERRTGGAQVLACHDYAGRHPGLGGLAVRARVVRLLVAHVTVDLEHSRVVA